MNISFKRIVLFFTVAVTVNVYAENNDIEKLGNELTPLGAVKAGNADGTIPAWQGGLTEPPAGYNKGDYYIDPFAEDSVLFTITNNNVSEYADKLSEGHKALLNTYPDTYKLNVYQSRRTAASPQHIYDATKRIAATAELTADGNGVTGAIEGIPFPIPENGLEVIWNHILRWRADSAERHIIQAAPTRSGNYTLVEFVDQFSILYNKQGMTEDNLNNILLYYKQQVVAPARLAGGILLVHETLNQNKEKRKAWLYNPGQRRVRRAPNVAFDNPGTATDGMRTNDQFDMYNGSPERYNWKLMGKKEIYVPYNNYKIASPELKYKDILTPLHINQDYPRYELHRVWVVEATLKDGSRHIYKKRKFYIDEDSWQILIVEQYDNRDQLWRVSEGLAMNFYDVPNIWTAAEVHVDLQAGRYLVVGLFNESQPYQYDADITEADFSPGALRREGKR
ncbi:MAG: DUF1329 domain-containing protein [Gammaproteobacteria bacterium]|jgi:hypothetical protein